MDNDKQVTTEQQKLKDLIGHEGWRIARQKFAEKVLELQSVADFADVLESGNAELLVVNMKANKRAAEVLFSFLRELEGAAEDVEKKIESSKDYIVNLEE